MVALDGISTLLAYHVNRVLDAAVGDNRNDRCVNNSKIFNTVHPQVGIDNTLANALRQTRSTARVERGLAPVENGPPHKLLVIKRHAPRVLAFNNVFKAIAMH